MCARAQIVSLLRYLALTTTHPKLLHVVQRSYESECRQESYMARSLGSTQTQCF
jgi:hypothetical protein